ncbi:MAG: hypothetical protein DU429_07485 [Candidatus Tokpelaia sp.]|nr:MAG: hypothetical protein DU430_08885 [Candidatus Tokpelaia sp.]KAA6205752.1 MAG: hypothetical protein DU429_07485 [Candidatus Tokpelaia sp.]
MMAKQPALFTQSDVTRIIAGAQAKGAHSIDVIKECADKVVFRINLKAKTEAKKEKNQDKGNIMSLVEYRAEQEREKTSDKITVF